MSASVFISGIRAADGKLADMVKLKTQCDKVGIDYPEQLREYFKGTEALDMRDPQDSIRAATELGLAYDLDIDGLTEGCVEYGNGMIINLEKLPSDIKALRVYMS